MKEQDFSTRLCPVQHCEANRLIDIFNLMMAMLQNERFEVREKNHFIDLLIQVSPQGIVILDYDERITDVNPAGVRLLKIDRLDYVLGKRIEEAGLELLPALSVLSFSGVDQIIRGGGTTIYRCIRSAFIYQGFSHPFLLVEELTHEIQKMEKSAYENIVRMMSHEVNNSIGAIGATLDIVLEILKTGGGSNDVLVAVEASSDRCGRLAQFICNLADVVRIPEPTFSDIRVC
jgi:PAS domain-containing protein